MRDVDPSAIARVGSYQNEAGREQTDGNEYGGLQIHAWRGLHDFLGARITELGLGGGRALDLASGTGAMALRLQHMGFDVTAVDLVVANFRLHGSIAFSSLDLNKPFSALFGEPFKLVMAVELIEPSRTPGICCARSMNCSRQAGQ